jgi:hypothetical protein
MIEIDELLLDESPDVISLSETSDLSLNAGGLLSQSSIGDIKYNALNIKTFLKKQPEKYVLVNNRKVNTVKPSPCWTRFALPEIKDENHRNIIIEKFATCRSCYTTYSYINGSTKSLNAHKCPNDPASPSSTQSLPSTQVNYHISTDLSYVSLVGLNRLVWVQKLIGFLLKKRKH